MSVHSAAKLHRTGVPAVRGPAGPQGPRGLVTGDAGAFLEVGGDFVNVKHPDIGAKGDGVADDTAALQFALSNYSNLYFPPGVYVISAMLRAAISRYTIRGSNGETTLRMTGSPENTSFLTFQSTNGTRLEQVSLSGIGLDGSANDKKYYGIQVNYCDFVRIEDLTTRCVKGSLGVLDATMVELSHLAADDQVECLSFQVIRRLSISNCELNNVEEGIDFWNAEEVTVNGVNIHCRADRTLPEQEGIDFSAVSKCTVTGLNVIGFDRSVNFKAHEASAHDLVDLTFTGCNFLGFAIAGLYSHNAGATHAAPPWIARKLKVTGCNIWSDRTDSAGVYMVPCVAPGVGTWEWNEAVFTGNTIHGNRRGVHLARYENFIFTGCSISAHREHGFYAENIGNGGVTIQGGRITSANVTANSYGICLVSVRNPVIIGVTGSAPNSTYMYLLNCYKPTVVLNAITGAGIRGIYIHHTDHTGMDQTARLIPFSVKNNQVQNWGTLVPDVEGIFVDLTGTAPSGTTYRGFAVDGNQCIVDSGVALNGQVAIGFCGGAGCLDRGSVSLNVMVANQGIAGTAALGANVSLIGNQHTVDWT